MAVFAALTAVVQPGFAAFPGTNGRIAFTSDRDGNDEIYVMNADGSAQTRLTNNAAIDVRAAWSRDGSKIVFTSMRDNNYEIYVMNADGSGQTNLTNTPGFGAPQDYGSVWSPDGAKIAFNSNRDANNEIYVMNSDGSAPTRLTNNSANDLLPDWQPFVVHHFSGFFSPVDNPPVLNTAKAGSAIPVKFSLGGNQGLDIFDPGYPASQGITCDTSAAQDPIEETATPGSTGLSYDAGTDQYTYVWKTNKAWANTCRQLIVRLNDHTSHLAYFNFKR